MCPLLLLVPIFCESRGAYIAGSGLCWSTFYCLRLKKILAICGAFAVAAVILASSGVGTHQCCYCETSDDRREMSDQSTMIRSQLYAGAWRQFQEDPLFGRYAVEMQFNFYPHNIYLKSLMSVGAIGSLPFAAHIVLALRSTVGIIRSGKFPLAAVLTAVIFIKEAIGRLGKRQPMGKFNLLGHLCSDDIVLVWVSRVS